MVFSGFLADFGTPESSGKYFSERTETQSIRENGKEKGLTDRHKPVSHRKQQVKFFHVFSGTSRNLRRLCAPLPPKLPTALAAWLSDLQSA